MPPGLRSGFRPLNPPECKHSSLIFFDPVKPIGLVLRTSYSRFLFDVTEPEQRIESELVLRLDRLSPFLRVSRIQIAGRMIERDEISAGLASGF